MSGYNSDSEDEMLKRRKKRLEELRAQYGLNADGDIEEKDIFGQA